MMHTVLVLGVCTMPDLTLSDALVIRVLFCLSGIRKQSLTAIRIRFKRRYPPSILENVHSVHERYLEIEHVLSFLVTTRLVRSESAPPNTVPEAEKFYILSHEGTQYMHRKK